MTNRIFTPLAFATLTACTSAASPTAPPPPPPPPAQSTAVATAAPDASIPSPAPSESHAVEEAVFTHPKLHLSFAYPASFSVTPDAAGVTVRSAPLTTISDRSDRNLPAANGYLTIRVSLQHGDVVRAAKRKVALFADSFPDGTTASFKPAEGYAEKVTAGPVAAYRFTMGSHGDNEEDTFVPLGTSTAVIECRYAGSSLSPALSEEAQLRACHRVLDTLKP